MKKNNIIISAICISFMLISMTVLSACGSNRGQSAAARPTEAAEIASEALSTSQNKESDIEAQTETDDSKTVNKEFNETQMYTLDGTKVELGDGTNIIYDPQLGFGIVLSDELQKMDGRFSAMILENSAVITQYISDENIKAMSDENISQDELIDAFSKLTNCFAVVRTNASDKSELDSLKTDFPKQKELVTSNDQTYYLLYTENPDTEGLSDSDKKNLEEIKAFQENIEKNIMIFPPEDFNEQFQQSAGDGAFLSIDTTDLNGNKVSGADFSKYDLTMINIWATWCGPCREELPGIEKMMSKLPEGVNLISICEDAADDPDLAKEVVDSEKLTFPVLLVNDSVNEIIMNKISAFPTTIFVDKNGNVVGDMIIGAPASGDAVTDAYLKEIDSRLKR